MATTTTAGGGGDAPAQDADARRAGEAALPPPLLSFLAAYPHPTCALAATPLHDALITRQILGHEASRETGPVDLLQTSSLASAASASAPATTSSSASTPTSAQPHTQPQPPAPGQQAPQQHIDPSNASSSPRLNGSFADSPLDGSATPSDQSYSNGGSSAGERVLASAFRGSNRALHHGQLGAFAGSTTSSAAHSHPNYSTLLEGGHQLPHDPSRTAEGAVAAMYEQRAAANPPPAESSPKPSAESIESNDSIPHDPSKESIAPPIHNTRAGADRWAAKRTDQAAPDRAEEGKGFALGELLRPVWSNKRWKEMMATKPGSGKEEELMPLAVLGRHELQRVLALLVEVLSDPNATIPSTTDRTISITLKFPHHSVHYRLPRPRVKGTASRSTLSPRSLAGEEVVPPGAGRPDQQGSDISISSSAGNSINNSNKYAVGSATSSAATDSGLARQTGEPTLQIVASYIASHDVILLTTVATNIFLSSPLPITSDPPSPSSFAQDPLESATPPFPGSTITRPPFNQRETSLSSLETISSSATVQPGRLSQSTTPNNASPGPSTPPAMPEYPSPSIGGPLPTDRLPEPPKDGTAAFGGTNSSFYNAEGAQLLDPRVPSIDPDMFVPEKRLRRRKTGASKSRISGGLPLAGVDEGGDEGGDEVDLNALSRGRRRGSNAGVDQRQTSADGEEDDEEDEDECALMSPPPHDAILDRELDALRDHTRTGSVTIEEEEDEGDVSELDAETPSVDVMTHRRLSLHDPGLKAFLQVISQTPCGRLIAAHPWERTSLGPLTSWDRELRSMTMLMLSSPFRCSLWWGEDSVLIYNDEYARLLAAKHPHVLGLGGAEGWSEIWDDIGPLAARVMQGETVAYYDHHLPMLRNGYLEETYHCWSYLPVRGASGKVIGYENTSFETTARVIAERRLSTMRDLVQVTQLARTIEEFCAKTLQVLALNEYDLPFALLYTVDPVNTNPGRRTAGATSVEAAKTAMDSGSKTGTGGSAARELAAQHLKLTLQGTIGVPERHPSAPPELIIRVDPTQATNSTQTGSESEDTASTASLSNTNTGSGGTTSATTDHGTTVWPFEEACQRRKPVYIDELGGRAHGFAQRGWPTPIKNAVVIPIVTESGNDMTSLPRAVLVVGLNPRRPWNEVFATFLSLLTRNLSNGLLAVSMAETEAQRNEELIKLDQAKTNFFSNVSHELRTPLTLILGPLEDVLSNRENLRPEDRQRLQVVQRHGNRLLNMVNTLLDFSRLEGGRMQVVYRPTKLSAMTADLASLFRSAIERGSVQLIVECEDDPQGGRPIYLAAELYEKVIFNLLGNAFKYTLSGSIQVRVSFDPKYGKVEIIDTGCGIEDTELGRIFERFHRVEGTSRSHEGTGIGLALTVELVKALGGTLSVASKVGEGSTFTCTFPRGCAHLPAAQVAEGEVSLALPPRAQDSLAIIEEAASWRLSSPNLSSTVHSSSRDLVAKTSSSNSAHSSSDDPFGLVSSDVLNLKDSTILVADDNHDLRHYITGLLSKAFHVVQAADGQEALEYAMRKPPSLIVTDCMMPRLGGQDLLKALRNNPSTALIPVIFLSAQAGAEARVEALLSGADDYLVKPFQGRELVARCNVHLQLGKMRIELERRVEERTRALVESEMRYRGLADRYSTLSLLSPVGIFLTDADGTINYANPRWYEISGYPLDKPLAEWRDCIHPADLPSVDKAWDDVIAFKPKQMGRREHVTHEFRFKKRENWVLWEMRSFHESGLRRGFVGSITDISTSKNLERLHVQAVEQRAADAEENRRNTEMFLDMSSHELRNPLSGVWQNAEVVSASLEKFLEMLDDLKDGEIPEPDVVEQLHDEMIENVEAVESIILCASHQQRIADDILNVSKLNMGLLSINLVPFELAAKMHEVLKMFEVECSQKQIRLRIDKGRSLAELGAEWIVADPGRISQILINFLSNSVKYTSEAKTRSVTIHLDAYAQSPPCPPGAMRVASAQAQATPPNTVWIAVGVRDSGKGLSPDDMRKLFARFAQANPKSDQYGGSGLGLYVSRKLVELHKGYIEVESTVGHGSVFRFAIPAERSGPPQLGSLTPPAPSAASSGLPGTETPQGAPADRQRAPVSSASLLRGKSASSVRPSFGREDLSKMTKPTQVESKVPKRILVVEDNFINQKVMTRQLKLAGYVVTVANNGREALDILLAEASRPEDSDEIPIAMILMDIEMPVMGGLEAIRLLREMERDGQLPRRYSVVAVTGNARASQIEECSRAGFDDYAVKPYSFADLLVQIRGFIGEEGDAGEG